MAALSACLANREAFPPEAAASALGQLVGRSPLPPLFMRFVMQVRNPDCPRSGLLAHPGPDQIAFHLRQAEHWSMSARCLRLMGGVPPCRRVRRGRSSSPLCWSC